MAKPWKWTAKRRQVCQLLAEGCTIKEAAEEAGVVERTVYRWKKQPEFEKRLDNLTLTTGVALKAERMRIYKRMIRGLLVQGATKKDLLDWVVESRKEMDGVKIGIADELAELIAGLSEKPGTLAGGGSGGGGAAAEEEAEEAG